MSSRHDVRVRLDTADDRDVEQLCEPNNVSFDCARAELPALPKARKVCLVRSIEFMKDPVGKYLGWEGNVLP